MTITRSSLVLLLFISVVSSNLSAASSYLRTTPRNLQSVKQSVEQTAGQSSTVSGDYYKQMLDAVNAERAKAGLSALCTNSKLQAAAKRHTDDMAKNNYMAHDGADGSTMSQRVTDAGYAWTAVAENVAAGQEDVKSVMESWMNSPGHRANILGADYTMMGTSYAYSESSTYKHYWTQDFGAGDTETCEGDSSQTANQTNQSAQSDQTDQTQQQDQVAGETSVKSDYTPSTTAPATKAPTATSPPATTTPPATPSPVATEPATKAPAQTPAPQTPGCKAKK
ncbi:hypothetical protein ON010_g6741 [Phytophthora cinnamomi]|nr:hypothetical protein ON010_g6741 [Phytophthora cinnamomi]